jgi:D-aminopeptidase
MTTRRALLASIPLAMSLGSGAAASSSTVRVRARDFGLAPGILSPGPLNCITDVAGVQVGHRTLIEGDAIRTGVTVVLPHGGNLFQDKVPAALAVGNGYGKLAGGLQVTELGELETPIALTNTLSVPAATAGLIDWTLRQPGNEAVVSVNAVVGETNDGLVNDIRARVVRPGHVLDALAAAGVGPVAEGNVGAGTGTQAFGWKGGIGVSSRRLPKALGAYSVGVLVQTNYGGVLTMMGAPVGTLLGRYYLKDELHRDAGDGSVMIIVATDAPVSDRNLARMARRTFLAIGRTGSPMTNGSGDFAIAFSTAESVRRTAARRIRTAEIEDLSNNAVSPLFEAVVEATEEAVYNAIIAAETQATPIGVLPKLPHADLRRILDRRYVTRP